MDWKNILHLHGYRYFAFKEGDDGRTYYIVCCKVVNKLARLYFSMGNLWWQENSLFLTNKFGVFIL